MLNRGLLEESDRAQGRRGPPQINLQPMAQAIVATLTPPPDDDAPLTLPPIHISVLPTQHSAAFGAAVLALSQY
ncbi:hypothetical protein [Musicola keenii]|uniref:hypothetical protein n=1 Tax=Musicola keenii TaxID=2884250 RepID=UPI001CE2FCF0|nr:hypothetical protein [Musicola keenii]